MDGRQVRLVDVVDVNSPDEVGRRSCTHGCTTTPFPTRDDLAKALVAYFTGHLGISTTMRAHEGIGTSQAHLDGLDGTDDCVGELPRAGAGGTDGFSTPTRARRSDAGMCYVRGAVHTEEGELTGVVHPGCADPSTAHHRHRDHGAVAAVTAKTDLYIFT